MDLETVMTELPGWVTHQTGLVLLAGSVGWLRCALEEWNVVSSIREIGDQETKMGTRRIVSLFYINGQSHSPYPCFGVQNSPTDVVEQVGELLRV